MVDRCLAHGLRAALLVAVVAGGVKAAPPPVVADLPYATLADRSLPAPIVAKLRILEVTDVKTAPAATSVARRAPRYVEAEVIDLIKGPPGLPAHIAFLVDAAAEGPEAGAKIKKTVQIIFAQPVAAHQNFVQLRGPESMIAWSPTRESLLRAMLKEAAALNAPPSIAGVDSAFSVAGTVAGERETQIFLTTNARPVSLVVNRHPDQAPQWHVALGEIIDSATPPPPRNTLLWYQLACHLPPAIPADKLGGMDSDQASAIRADYAFIRSDLGSCR